MNYNNLSHIHIAFSRFSSSYLSFLSFLSTIVKIIRSEYIYSKYLYIYLAVNTLKTEMKCIKYADNTN